MKINVVDRLGIQHEIDADVGLPLETVITQSGIESSFGICGGACACSSCQVYVSQEDYDKLTPPADDETSVLEDTAHEAQSTSRLSCQVEVSENMEGMTFTIAPY